MKVIQAKLLLSGRGFKTVILVVVTFLAGYFVHSLLQQSPSDQEDKHPGEHAAEQRAEG